MAERLVRLEGTIYRLTQELSIAREALRDSEAKLEVGRIEAARMLPVYEAAMAYQSKYDTGEYEDGEDDMVLHRELLEACRAQKEDAAR